MSKNAKSDALKLSSNDSDTPRRSTLSRQLVTPRLPKALAEVVYGINEAGKRARSLSGAEIAKNLVAAARIYRCLLGPMDLLCAEIIKRPGDLSAADVADCCWALGTLNHASPDAFIAMGHRARALLSAGEITPKQIVLVAWAFAVRDERHSLFEPASQLWETLSARRGELVQDVEATLHQVLMWRRALGSEPSLPDGLRHSCAAAFMRERSERMAARDQETRNEVRVMIKVLTMPSAKKVGLIADGDYSVESFSVDALVQIGDDAFLVEFDGASNFVEIVEAQKGADGGGKRPALGKKKSFMSRGGRSGAEGGGGKGIPNERHDGATAFKYRVLRSLGHQVISVPYREWEKRRGKDEDLLAWLRKLMREEKRVHTAKAEAEASERAQSSWKRAITRVKNQGSRGFANAVLNSLRATHMGGETAPHVDTPGGRAPKAKLADERKRRASMMGRMGKSMKSHMHLPHMRRHSKSTNVEV